MAEQERKQPRRSEAPTDVGAEEAPRLGRGGELTDKIDDLLDEIDSVLEENAEEFVRNYVQKGGQ
jgi:ubiquitin-like protein Pup